VTTYDYGSDSNFAISWCPPDEAIWNGVRPYQPFFSTFAP
jgi:hypothetical protein